MPTLGSLFLEILKRSEHSEVTHADTHAARTPNLLLVNGRIKNQIRITNKFLAFFEVQFMT